MPSWHLTNYLILLDPLYTHYAKSFNEDNMAASKVLQLLGDRVDDAKMLMDKYIETKDSSDRETANRIREIFARPKVVKFPLPSPSPSPGRMDKGRGLSGKAGTSLNRTPTSPLDIHFMNKNGFRLYAVRIFHSIPV